MNERTEKIIEALLNERSKTQDPERIAQIDKKLDELGYTGNATSAGNNSTGGGMSAGDSELTNVQEAFTSAYLDAFEGKGDAHGNMGKALLVAYEATVHFNRPKEIRLAMCIIGRMAKKDIYTLPDTNYKAVLTQLDKDIAAASEEAKAERTKSILQNAMTSITEQAASIKDTLTNPASIETLTSAKESIKLLQSTLDNAVNDIAQETIKRERTPDEMIAEATDGTDTYPCKMLDDIEFKYGTLSFIGARTSRGKTTALSSIAIDALTSGRRILFLTLEETDRQILRRLIMCYAMKTAIQSGDNEIIDALEHERNPFDTGASTNPISAYKAWEYGVTHKHGRGTSETFAKAMYQAYKQVNDWYKSGRIIFHNGAGEGLLSLVASARKAGEGDIVLFDYAQLAPADGLVTDAYGKKVAVDATDKALLAVAREKNCVVIAGAQFNRSSTEYDKDTGDDTFTEKSFADCGDMETIAHILIGIGWNDFDHNARFYTVLKNREGTSGEVHDLTFKGAYSYMWSVGNERVMKDPLHSKRAELWAALQKAWKGGKDATYIGKIVLDTLNAKGNTGKGSKGKNEKWHSDSVEIKHDDSLAF